MRTVWIIGLAIAVLGAGFAQADKAGKTETAPATPTAEQQAPSPEQKAPSPEPTAAPEAKPTPRETTLEFDAEGERWWWTEDKSGTPLAPPKKTQDKNVLVKLPENAETLWVLEVETGNLARLPVSELKEKTEMTRDRWTHVARLQVNLRAQAQPVASAIVELTDAKGNRTTRVLEPTAEGVVVFERVPIGKITLKATPPTGDSTTQEVTLSASREGQRVPIVTLSLSGDVDTVKPTAQTQAEQEPAPTSRIGAIVMFLVAGALAIAVIFFLIRLATQKPAQLSQAMQKLGVELPTPPQGDAGTSVPTLSPPPAPDLPPLESAGVPPTASPVSVSTSPATRIVCTQGTLVGTTFSLEADMLTVGREEGNTIALTQEPTVSRRHAQFIRQGDTVLVEDLGSTNGTFVNGVRISAPTPVRPGDTVQFGAVIFRVE